MEEVEYFLSMERLLGLFRGVGNVRIAISHFYTCCSYIIVIFFAEFWNGVGDCISSIQFFNASLDCKYERDDFPSDLSVRLLKKCF